MIFNTGTDNVESAMSAVDPEGTGSLSMNRRDGTEVGEDSATLGHNNTASGDASMAIGTGTNAGYDNQLAAGKYNAPRDGAVVIGNGAGDGARNNIFAMDWDGTVHVAGGAYEGAENGVGGARLARQEIIADAYSSSGTYSVGEYVVYGPYLYRCKTGISEPEAWTEAHWEQVRAMDEVVNRAGKHPYSSLERLRSYLYRITFSHIPEYTGEGSLPTGGCSSFVSGGKLYRNFDWYYDESPSFLVVCKGFRGMAIDNSLTDGAEMDDRKLGQLPYHLVDGINEHGIMMSTHVLYNDWGWYGSGNRNIPMTAVPYLIMTQVTSMANIGSELANVIGDLYVPESMGEYLCQFVITDGTTTYVLTNSGASSGAYMLIDISANPKLTNFRWTSLATVERNAAYMQTRPNGVERWNSMSTNFKALRFTKAYTSNDRLSEFIGINHTTKASSDATLQAIYETAHGMYLERERNGELWQTVHSVVYGTDGMEKLFVQEDFDTNWAGGGTGSGGGHPYALTLTIPADGWTNHTQTIAAPGVEANDNIHVSPAPSNLEEYSTCGIVCTEQGENSLTFVCDTDPTNDMTVYVASITGENSGSDSLYVMMLTLPASGWANNTQTVTASGIGALDTVHVSPAPQNLKAYSMCGVACTAQAENVLTFICDETPEDDLLIYVAANFSEHAASVELSSNKTQTINSGSTQTQYPSAKAVYTELQKTIDKQQGASNAGKVLGIGNDGNVIPVPQNTGHEYTAGTGIRIDNYVISLDVASAEGVEF